MDEETLLRELNFKAVRSSGAGGQHVNKVATKVLLSLDLMNSQAFSDPEKLRLADKLRKRLNAEGVIQLYSDSGRSQHKNKELAIKRLLELLKDALKVPKKRRKTKPSVRSIKKRLEVKKQQSQKKTTRKKPPMDK